MDLDRGYTCYLRAKELNLPLSLHTMTALLSLASGLGEIGCGNLRPRLTDPPRDLQKALQIFQDMKTQNLEMREAAYSSIIRSCCDHGLKGEGLTIYEEMKAKNVAPKLRTITSLLDVFSSENKSEKEVDSSSFLICEKLFHDGVDTYQIIFTEKEYYYLLRSCYYLHKVDSFFEYLHILMEELLLIRHPETLELVKSFFTEQASPSLQSPENPYIIQESSVSDEGRVEVNHEQLLSIDLSETIQKELLEKIQSFAVNRDGNSKYKPNNKIKYLQSTLYQLHQQKKLEEEKNEKKEEKTAIKSSEEKKHDENHKTTDNNVQKKGEKIDIYDKENRLEQWRSFENHLQSLHQQHCHSTTTKNKKNFIILDGANIGYYNQNFRGAPNYINYQQIQYILNCLLGKEDENKEKKKTETSEHHEEKDISNQKTHENNHCEYFPIIILHSRHLKPQLSPHSKEYQQIQSLLQEWKEKNYLFTTPKGFNDDWYWMYATIKYHCYVITNDDMRDHHFQLLSPK
jgi:pentatricopeptide repeat protein